MALKQCRECGKDVSSSATKCLHCGVSNPSGGINFRVGGVGGVLAGIVLICLFVTVVQNFGDNSGSVATAAPSNADGSGAQVAQAPASESTLLRSFADACVSYDAQPNEIKKSAVYRATASFYSTVGRVAGWTGLVDQIITNQGGSNATIVLKIGRSKVFDTNVPMGSKVYDAASNMTEGQAVTFSGRDLSDMNLTERGKVCDPDFSIHLTSLTDVIGHQ